ncbi:UDP-N-acetylglucosamine--N-acetylmuramyl-(pentapeptide) pyrophosphoryl-undecaprenol N-acetylglucosamine transferase [Patescibacteria group bacterium]|nr:UDP-N-acetylglucosamine--N-acetylmuramyl-(pentapeptide) pyrophosphoryl-undecaprenol N-acetylglucosamine transferase [Patescibacteria group bacterium]MCL5091775.1 UDP-N-acetylglucosamine--N-acetylmuramyl-(pentapeptide) pyrophosphoryl-undecaprenol N-acetylglucosamine transferase [Patescibacteria group bacterium]
MKILITGGHVTPALSVIDALRRHPRWRNAQIFFVGRRYVSDREKTLSYEYQSVTKRQIRFYHLWAGRLTRTFSLANYLSLVLIPLGFFHALYLALRIRPRFVLSFGGYVALPVAVSAWLMGIPVYTHEQTMKPGLTNRLIGQFAQRVFLAFPQAQPYFSQPKILVTGNPVRRSIFIHNKTMFGTDQRPTIYVTGGSLGAHALNQLVEEILPDLLKRYRVIHQTGAVRQYRDYDRLLKRRYMLPAALRNFYFVQEQIDDEEIGSVFFRADLVVGRSGANTVYELLMLKKPALLVPLPWSANDEQLCHARYLQENGLGEIFFQRQPARSLLSAIEAMIGRIHFYQDNYRRLSLSLPINASEKILAQLPV